MVKHSFIRQTMPHIYGTAQPYAVQYSHIYYATAINSTTQLYMVKVIFGKQPYTVQHSYIWYNIAKYGWHRYIHVYGITQYNTAIYG